MYETLIESILFYTNEPMRRADIAEYIGVPQEELAESLVLLEHTLSSRGIVLVHTGDEYSLATSAASSEVIEKIARDELDRDLSKASLETLSIILYKAPVTRKEIEYIRGVNVSYSLRALSIRGLVEKVPSVLDERIFLYRPTTDALKYLGMSSVKDLPGYEEIGKQIIAGDPEPLSQNGN